MSTRWVGSVVGGAVIGMLAVGTASWIGRGDPKSSTAAPEPAPVAGSVVKSITVKGEGAVKVKPDTASLSVGVQATAPTATEALAQANTSAAALIAAVEGRRGERRTTSPRSGVSIYPQSTVGDLDDHRVSSSEQS